jgi:hypothetical protein
LNLFGCKNVKYFYVSSTHFTNYLNLHHCENVKSCLLVWVIFLIKELTTTSIQTSYILTYK